jgi:hypothetical protein
MWQSEISTDDATNVQPQDSEREPELAEFETVSRARVFVKMSNQQQRDFVTRRFRDLDPGEVADIVTAIYGGFLDGRRRRNRAHRPYRQIDQANTVSA